MPDKSYDEGPNCRKCKHMGYGLPGTYHISCEHPEANPGGKDNPLATVLSILASVGRGDPVVNAEGALKLGLKASAHGIRKGWFNWPLDFDPTWLRACNGFEEKE